MLKFTSRLAAVVLALCAISVSVAHSQEKKKLTVLLDWAPTGMHAAVHLAKQKGWYDQAGLNVEIIDGKGSTGTIQQVAAGQYDVGFVHLGTMAAAVSNGVPVTSIACFMRSSDYGLMVPEASGWKSLKDLKGKKIAVAASAGVAAFLDPYLKASGMTRADFDIVSVDNSVLISTYTSGKVDAALSTVAFFLPIVGKTRVSSGVLMSDAGINVPGYGFIVRKGDVDKNAAALSKLIEVNQKAWRYILDGHHDEAVDAILAQREVLRLDRAIIAGQLKAHIPFFDTAATKGKPIGWQADTDWQSALKAMANVGMVNGSVKPEDVYTNKLIGAN